MEEFLFKCKRCEDENMMLKYRRKEDELHVLYCYCKTCGDQYEIEIEEE